MLCSATAYAGTNWESGDAAGLAEALNGDNLWRIRDKNNKSIFDAEGLRAYKTGQLTVVLDI